MKMTAKTYDSRVYDLAELFLSDEAELNTEENKDLLARFLQEAIEGEIEFMRDEAAKRKQTGG